MFMSIIYFLIFFFLIKVFIDAFYQVDGNWEIIEFPRKVDQE